MNQDLEQIIFHNILRNKTLVEKTKAEYFSISYIRELFRLLKPYVIQYNSIPSADQVVKIVSLSDVSADARDYLNTDVIYQIWKMRDSLDNYDDEWLENTTKAFLSWQTLMFGMRNAMTFVKTVQADINVENYQELVDKARSIFTTDTSITFNNDGAGADLFDPGAHKPKEMIRYSTGYPFLDRGSKGGFWPGSLWCFMGGPKSGKSRCLQNLAAKSVKIGYNCAYCSFELQEEIILQRMGSNLFDIKMDDYDNVANDPVLMNKKIKEFRDQSLKTPGRFIVKSFPTSATSMNDIETWLLSEEKRISEETGAPFKFKNIFLDYLNIMRNWRNPNSENTYMKIKQLAEDARAMAMKNGWCVITATQIKQAYFNSSDLQMDSASESSALAATVDMFYGIITDVMMMAAHEQYWKCILSRVSPNVNERKKININEDYMRCEEDQSSQIIKDEELAEDFADKTKKIVTQYRMNSKAKDTIVVPQASTVGVAPQLGITEITGNQLFQ